MTKVKSLAPYGDANFEWIRRGSYAYVDKTRFIEALEKYGSRCLFLVRPDGFGKSLFTETLAAYYDKAAASDFEPNFAGTYIEAHRTEKASGFHVVKFDFSGISPGHLTTDFVAKVKRGLGNFCQRYGFDEGCAVLDREHVSAPVLWTDFMQAFVRRFDGKLCLLIDAYDQFANEMLAEDGEQFEKLTTKGSLVKAFYASIKAEMVQGTVERVFITGVTALPLGLDWAADCTLDSVFAEMYGFTESELRSLIPRLLDLSKHSQGEEEVLDRMKTWHAGYCFNADAGATVFNAAMCLYYLDFVQRNNREPDDMAATVFSHALMTLEAVFRRGSEDFIRQTLVRALQGENIDFPSGRLQLLNLNDHQALDEDGLLSALVYLGFLTFVPGNRFALRIPNRAVGVQFLEYYLKRIQGVVRWRCAARTPQ